MRNRFLLALLLLVANGNFAIVHAQQDCKPYYRKFETKAMVTVLDMIDRAEKQGKDVLLNSGHALVARKKGPCTTDIEVYEDEQQTNLWCTESVATCGPDKTK